MVRNGGKKAHQGLDILASVGTSVTAADAGVVVFAGANGDHGNQVIIGHKNSDGEIVSYTSYSHLESISVSKDAAVTGGEQIGTSGKTGNANSPAIPAHLHFEIRTANPAGRGLPNRVDPLPEIKP
jgi:murein DD-endopeptidase MepM/ murein hydrolase activator NlpD